MSHKVKKKLAIALDAQDKKDFINLYSKLQNLPAVFKIGLRTLPQMESPDWRLFKDKEIFVDAKLHDIPSQVGDAVKSYADMGAHYLTVHLSGGRKMLEAALKAAQGYPLQLLGVSALTSLSNEDIKEIGFQWEITQLVQQLVNLGVSAGFDAFVMSAQELKSIKGEHPEIFCVTPGITLENNNGHSAPAPDQSRTCTLRAALELGSDMPVIGRAIIHAPNPKISAQSALEMIEKFQ
jgi:orotidine-5'-phosphate decarboxylase